MRITDEWVTHWIARYADQSLMAEQVLILDAMRDLQDARARIKELEKEKREDQRAVDTERKWQERQGEEYGSY